MGITFLDFFITDFPADIGFRVRCAQRSGPISHCIVTFLEIHKNKCFAAKHGPFKILEALKILKILKGLCLVFKNFKEFKGPLKILTAFCIC